MASLTIKNVPDPILARLRKRAVAHRRSLKSEVIACLESITGAAPVDPEALLARIRAVRVSPRGMRLTDRHLSRLKGTGRP